MIKFKKLSKAGNCEPDGILRRVFSKVFEGIKSYLRVGYPVDEEELSPNTLALKLLIDSLPCRVDIIELKFKPSKYEIIEDETCQLIKYDFSKLGSLSVGYHGALDATELQKLRELLLLKHPSLNPSKFGIKSTTKYPVTIL